MRYKICTPASESYGDNDLAWDTDAIHVEGIYMSSASSDHEAILDVNQRMNLEETRGVAGVPFFREILDQSLRFRRASGAIVTRDEFLIDLANPMNTRERIETINEPACDVHENTAVVSVVLHVVGCNGAKRFEGRYRNIRIFHRGTDSSPWRLKIWFNDDISSKG